MRRSVALDALIRAAQPFNVVALPVLIWQGKQVRAAMPRLPEASGPTTGVSPGQPPGLRLTVLGDSAAAGVGAIRHEEALAGFLGAEAAARTGREVSWRVVARSGAKTRDVRRELVPQLTDPTDVVVVVVGVNDLKSYRLIRDFRRDTHDLIGAVRQQAGPVPIVLAGIPPFQHMPGLPRPMRTILELRGRAMDDVLRRLARRETDVRHIPLATQPQLGDDIFTQDGFHLASDGYRLWAALVAAEVATATQAPTTMAGGGNTDGQADDPA
jgi:lysophospholipase L1-like esterase